VHTCCGLSRATVVYTKPSTTLPSRAAPVGMGGRGGDGGGGAGMLSHAKRTRPPTPRLAFVSGSQTPVTNARRKPSHGGVASNCWLEDAASKLPSLNCRPLLVVNRKPASAVERLLYERTATARPVMCSPASSVKPDGEPPLPPHRPPGVAPYVNCGKNREQSQGRTLRLRIARDTLVAAAQASVMYSPSAAHREAVHDVTALSGDRCYGAVCDGHIRVIDNPEAR
jgi:hypothetical protein